MPTPVARGKSLSQSRGRGSRQAKTITTTAQNNREGDGLRVKHLDTILDSASNLLCDLRQVPFPLWAPVSQLCNEKMDQKSKGFPVCTFGNFLLVVKYYSSPQQ